MNILRAFLTDDDLREALDHARPGVIDPCSWAYWNSKLGRFPVLPLPTRRLGYGGVTIAHFNRLTRHSGGLASLGPV
jgi:hypothetical protein